MSTLERGRLAVYAMQIMEKDQRIAELEGACREALKCIEKHVPDTEFAPRQWLREVLAKAAA